MKACIYTIFIVFGIQANNFAQNPIGARSAGIGGFSVGMKDLWAAENNLAALSFHQKKEIGISHSRFYTLKELSHTSLVASFPLSHASFGLSFSRFGFQLYNENKLGLGYGKKLTENFAVGVQLNYQYTKIAEDYGSKNSLFANIALLANISEDLSLAVVLANPTKAKLSEYMDERHATYMRVGLQYDFSKKVFLGSEIQKSLHSKSILRLGLEYLFEDSFFLRAGMSSNPQLSSFGFGYQRKGLKMDFASSFHNTLGFSPQFSMQFLIEKANESR